MKSLLIVGAGEHGQVVAEIAKDLDYKHIAFLDDNNPDVIGKIDEMENFCGQYTEAFCGIGNNKLRGEILRRLEMTGFHIATLIHMTAYVSKSAKIEPGTLVEPKAIINTNSTINKGSIISVGAIVDHNVCIGTCCHINAGAIVKAGGSVDDYQKLEAGQLVLRCEKNRVKPPDSNDEFARNYRERTGKEVSFF